MINFNNLVAVMNSITHFHEKYRVVGLNHVLGGYKNVIRLQMATSKCECFLVNKKHASEAYLVNKNSFSSMGGTPVASQSIIPRIIPQTQSVSNFVVSRQRNLTMRFTQCAIAAAVCLASTTAFS